MTTTLSPLPVLKFFDNNGNPLAAGLLYTYQAGTTTPLATYTDSTGATPNTNPVVLNARGEAQVWVPANTAYKYVLTDSAGNQIWAVDQIVNAQLLTFYAGVDTGVANAYVLNFSASISGYTDGLVIYWVPSNSNTGPATINVNGLGVVAITNTDGSALGANAIQTNQLATVVFRSGSALLLTSATVQTGTFSVTYAGFSSAPGSTTWTYRRTGNVVTIGVPNGSGTSNATTFTATSTNAPAGIIPFYIYSTGTAIQFPIQAYDNGATQSVPGSCFLTVTGAAPAGQMLFTFYKDWNAGAWTASGSKAAGSVGSYFTYSV